ncbi:MAG: hypothetical protein PHC51_08330, partial [bacterium]|nr:hypothetical protein [bacterium]
MPDGDDIGLDYRLSPEKARDSRHYVVFLLVFGASATLGIIFIAHLFGKVFAHQITLVLVLLVGVFTALRKILAREKWPVILFYGFRWPVVWLVVTVSGLLSPKILLIIGVAACVWLADAIATHHVLWLNADPNLGQETRTTIKTAWHQRWRSWGLRLAAVSLLVYSALLLMAGSQIISGVTSLLAVTTLFAAVSTVILLKQAGSFDPIRLFLDAMVNWLTYGRFGTDSPGVWQSPRGEWGARIGATLCAYILVASAILPFASYFPVVLVEGDKSPWVKVYAESRGHKFSASSLLGRWNEYRVPDFRDIVLHRLSHADSVYLRKLKNEDARTAYLHKQQLADYLSSSPGAWLSVMLDGVFMGEAQFYWAALLAFLGCLVFPLIVSMLMLFVVSGALLERFAREIERRMPVRRNNWEGYIKRLQTSPNALARQHLWLGNHATEDYPILIHQDVLCEHAHILGDSGSGKSALAVAPIFTQLIR